MGCRDNNVYVFSCSEDFKEFSTKGVCSVSWSRHRLINSFMPTVPTFAVRETASLGIMGEPRVPPLNPSETIVLSEHYRL